MSNPWPDDERVDGPAPTPSLFATRWAETGRGLAGLFLPADGANFRHRVLSVTLTVGSAVVAGDWACTLGERRWGTWWVCGMLAVTSAAVVTGWLGTRLPFAMPFLLPMLTLPVSLVCMGLARGVGYDLDGLHGINALVLSVASGFAGIVPAIPMTVIWACRSMRS